MDSEDFDWKTYAAAQSDYFITAHMALLQVGEKLTKKDSALLIEAGTRLMLSKIEKEVRRGW